MVLWLLLTSCSSLLLRLLPSARPHGISRQSFLVYPLDLRTRVTVAFGVFDVSCHLARRVRLHIQFLSVGPRFRYCFFSPAPHDANLASRYGGSSATTPLVDFHHRLTACPSYTKKDCMSAVPYFSIVQNAYYMLSTSRISENLLPHTLDIGIIVANASGSISATNFLILMLSFGVQIIVSVLRSL